MSDPVTPGTPVDKAILFADVSGSTRLYETLVEIPELRPKLSIAF